MHAMKLLTMTALVALGCACGGQAATSASDGRSASPRCPQKGSAVPTQVDATWIDVEPSHPLLPIRMKLPPNVESELDPDSSQTEALYAVYAGPGIKAVLQFAVGRLESPDEFFALFQRDGATLEKEVRSTTFAGRAATQACATIKERLPFAVAKGADGHMREIAAHVEQDRYVGYFVKVGDRVFRASYRISDRVADEWEPVFQAILGTITWR